MFTEIEKDVVSTDNERNTKKEHIEWRIKL